MLSQRLGYLVPEFPAQTHAFFWREASEIERRGVEVDFVTTRLPVRRLMSHSWAEQALKRTHVLFPLGVAGGLRAIGQLLSAGPGGWLAVAKEIAHADLPIKGKLRLVAMTLVAARLLGFARERGWDHLHAHSCADAAHVALLAYRLGGLPYSVTLHGPLHDYGPNQRRKWAGATFAVVITKKLEREVHQTLGDAVPERLALAPMGVQVENFTRTQTYEPWDGRGPLKLFSCGRLNPCKGHGDLIQAVAQLREQGTDARLRIAGEDEKGGAGYHQTLQQLIDRLGVGQAVELMGAVGEDAIKAELESAHVFALASLHEPLGVAIMEAMATHTPVVATNQGGVAELVADGEDGLLVPAESPEAMAQAIQRLAGDPELTYRLSQRGGQTVAERFHSGVSAQVLVDEMARSQNGNPESSQRASSA